MHGESVKLNMYNQDNAKQKQCVFLIKMFKRIAELVENMVIVIDELDSSSNI